MDYGRTQYIVLFLVSVVGAGSLAPRAYFYVLQPNIACVVGWLLNGMRPYLLRGRGAYL